MFGAPQASTGFSFGSAPAFGAAGSAPAFGSSTPAFGGTPAFGATSTPAFGAASSAPAFGASSAPAFGAPASGGGFSFASTPASGFGSTSTFGASSASGFGASSTPPFGQSAPQPTLFGGFGQQPAQQAQQQQQQVPFTRATTFESLPPDFQKYLQQIQDQMSKFEADRLKVQQLPHLQETPGQQQGMDSEIAAVRADLKELSKDIKIQMESVQDVKEKAQKLLKACDTICNVYNRNRGWRMEMQLKGVQDLSQYLQEPINLPGPFLQDSVLGFCQAVAELSKVLDEVEQVLQTSGLQDPSQVDWRYVLPTIVSNMHDYFIAVAAKLERAHTEVERLKPAYLAHRRAQGIYTDPFERARRQEQLQHQQQRPAPSAAAQQHGALPAAAAGALPALPAPPSGGMFGAQTPATPAPQATPGMGAGSFGSPFLQAGTPLGASPFGGNANAGLSRSASKPKSKKR